MVDWLVSLAPSGVIEFVPKTDAMVVELLKLREDIFYGYTIDNFLKCLNARARVTDSKTISASGRSLIQFER